MSFPNTYSGLVSAIQEVSEDNGIEFVSYIPNAIFIAEEEIAKVLDMSRFEQRITTNVVEPSGVSVNTGIVDSNSFLYFNHVFHNNRKLDRVDYSFIREINRFETSTGTSARYYAFLNDPNTIFLAPPVSSGTVEAIFTARPERLGNANQTNEIINNAPDILFYGTMVQMSLFMKNWETLPIWRQFYSESLDSHLNTTRRERTDVGQGDQANSFNSQSTRGNV